MIGDLYETRAGLIWEHQSGGWHLVGRDGLIDIDELEGGGILAGLGGLLTGVVAFIGLAVVSTVMTAILLGIALGAVVVYFPVALPFSVLAAIGGVVVVGIRASVQKRRLGPIGVAAGAVVVFLVSAAVSAVFWFHPAMFPLYRQIAALPILAVALAALAAVALTRKGLRRLGILLLVQAAFSLFPYIEAVGRRTYQDVGYDNVVSIFFWLVIVALTLAWFSPRRGPVPGAPEAGSAGLPRQQQPPRGWQPGPSQPQQGWQKPPQQQGWRPPVP